MLLQIPGGPELLIILLVSILIFGIPLLLIVIVGALYFRAEGGDDEDVADRVAELEAEIATLQEQIDADSVENEPGHDRTEDENSAE